MDNLQNLSSLFNEQSIFVTINIGVFFVFICGVSKSLLYLAGEKSAYLFDSVSISSYLTKTASPEPIRLKILFLSYPQAEKAILTEYLKEPSEKPSKMFAKTLEQLKCDILTVTGYNRNIAMFFLLVSGVTILSSSVQNIETKILGMISFSLVLFCIDWTCNGLFAVMKYYSYKSFKHLTQKLDDFHPAYNAKFRNGLLGTQNQYSPFLKSVVIPAKNSEIKKPKMKVIDTADDTCDFEKRPHQIQIPTLQTPTSQTPTPQIPTTKEAVNMIATPQTPPTSTTNPSNQPSVASLLEKIKTATDNLDFDSFEVLSENLASLTTSQTLSPTDHKTLQEGLDAFLKEFREVEEKLG